MRTLFPARTLALHAALNEADLPHTCTVQEPGTPVSDGEGGWATPWADLASLPCRLSPLGTATERMIAGQVAPKARFLVTFEAATVIPLNARLAVTIEEETLYLDPHGSNGPRSWEAQRKYECSLWEAARP